LGYGGIKVVTHDPGWAAAFEAEAARILAALEGEAVAVHHVGSTAIPGIGAKPIIDILLEVRDVGRLDGLNGAMEALGYEAKGEFGIAGRRYFTKNRGPVRTHNVHAFGSGDPEVERHLAFRDYMKAHPEEARAYGELKARLAREHPDDIEAYMDGKDAFVKEMDRRAGEWRRGGRS
jgi:GrpB-like predicted nucleotidyltransferase (UPF0157 family)